MSFSDTVKTDLWQLPVKNNCCRRAFALGLLYDALSDPEDTARLSLPIVGEEAARKVAQALEQQFKRDVDLTSRRYLGRDVYTLTLHSTAAGQLLSEFDANDDPEKEPFSCPGCAEHFFRGVFLSTGSCADPEKSAHLELLLHDARRASRLYSLLRKREITPGIINRKNGCGLYFKKSALIIDFMTLIGDGRMSFDLLNRQIERDIRNNENRATNCVTRNIQSSVSASAKQIAAIEKLIDLGKLDTLAPELLATAELRLHNEDATMAELAALHDPPISKSGLNHRLEKIIELSAESDKHNRSN